jgi:iron complex outermembrane receptor protein
MNEFKFLINSKQIISLTIWLNNNKRRLPSINNLSESKIYQQDYSDKVTANWSVIYPNHKSIIRAGYFNDKINYTDSLKSDFSKNNSQTFIAENENYFNWGKSHQFNLGVNYTSNSANSNNYNSLKNLSRLSFLAGNKFTFFNNRWLTYLSIRADYLSVGKLPLTGNVSTEFNLTKKIILIASAAKIYRQPTLNELYWMPGGNINLKPEQGFSYDGTIAYKNQINNLLIYISGAAFTRQINNWILWTSSANGNPTPINLMQVWSRGTETTWRFEYKKNKLIYKLNFGTAYILSTTQQINQENNNSLNKQLIYTPRYSANAVFSVTYNKFDVCFYNHYVGYRFTASDNSQWLNPYHVSSVRLNYTVEFKYAQFILFSACNNLFNTDYKIVSGRPMPLRNFELGLTLQNKTTLK